MPPFSKQQYHELLNIASVFSKNKSKILIFIFVLVIIVNRRVADFQTLCDFLLVDLLTEFGIDLPFEVVELSKAIRTDQLCQDG